MSIHNIVGSNVFQRNSLLQVVQTLANVGSLDVWGLGSYGEEEEEEELT